MFFRETVLFFVLHMTTLACVKYTGCSLPINKDLCLVFVCVLNFIAEFVVISLSEARKCDSKTHC